MKMVTIADIRINGGTQSRAGINRQVVADYAEAIRGGAEFPPVVLFFDGSAYWLADGFHRYEAHAEAGANEVAADVRQGTQRDAILYSVGANATHGLRRTNEDKRRAVMMLLGDPEWSQWSNREVARRCGASEFMVRSLRENRSDEPRTYTTKHGTTYAIADIGMRMLTPREQFRAQGFPDSYQIEQGPGGRPLTKTEQTRMCGNSVAPQVAAALVRANCGNLIGEEAAA